MDEDQIERLIELIQTRPPLYDKRLKEYADRHINKMLWKEVCEAIIDSWNIMTPEEKIVKVKEVQQRWQNLRTCFKRELNRSKTRDLSKKRRKYIYYNQLLFLLPTMQDSEPVTPTSTQLQGFPHRVLETKPKNCAELNSNHQLLLEQPVTRTENIKMNSKSFKRSALKIRSEGKDEIDEDTFFLLSLVPSFRKMTDDQKIEAKIEFLTVGRVSNLL